MRSIRWAIVCVFSLLPALAQVSLKPGRHQFGPIQGLVDHRNGTDDSTNWSGYAVTGSSFTSAEGSWVMPAADCTGVAGKQYAAFWVGLDGYNSKTVEQTGTEADCDQGKPNYYAWIEFYPGPSLELTGFPINPGDLISASVVYSDPKFVVTITDVSTAQTFSTSARVPGAQRSSAEWITEAPCCTVLGGILPLSDFGTDFFGFDSTGQAGSNNAADSTTSGPIANFGTAVEQITKVAALSSPQTSTCSALSSDGTSFSCTWAAGR